MALNQVQFSQYHRSFESQQATFSKALGLLESLGLPPELLREHEEDSRISGLIVVAMALFSPSWHGKVELSWKEHHGDQGVSKRIIFEGTNVFLDIGRTPDSLETIVSHAPHDGVVMTITKERGSTFDFDYVGAQEVARSGGYGDCKSFLVVDPAG